MKKVGYPQESIDLQEAKEIVAENPNWETQGAFRHHEHPDAQSPEQEADQSVSEPLVENVEEAGGTAVHFETIGFREKTGHKTTS
ncbi:MAG TPA: hypothetical protein V6C82_07175 [Chroococcales cyanobacterium]